MEVKKSNKQFTISRCNSMNTNEIKSIQAQNARSILVICSIFKSFPFQSTMITNKNFHIFPVNIPSNITHVQSKNGYI